MTNGIYGKSEVYIDGTNYRGIYYDGTVEAGIPQCQYGLAQPPVSGWCMEISVFLIADTVNAYRFNASSTLEYRELILDDLIETVY